MVIYSDCNWEKIPRLNPSEISESGSRKFLLAFWVWEPQGNQETALWRWRPWNVPAPPAPRSWQLSLAASTTGNPRNGGISGVKSEKCEKGSVMKENGIYGVGGKDLWFAKSKLMGWIRRNYSMTPHFETLKLAKTIIAMGVPRSIPQFQS